MRINKHDTNGTKPLLGKGELGYDDYTAEGDTGRVYVGTGTENIPLAKRLEANTMTKAQFNALAEERKANRTGSGFDEMGKHFTGVGSAINEGMWSYNAISNILKMGRLNGSGTSKTDTPIVNINGVKMILNRIFNSLNVNENTIKFGGAPNIYPYDTVLTTEQINSGVVKHADASNSGLVQNGKGLSGTTFTQTVITVNDKKYTIEYVDNSIRKTLEITATSTTYNISLSGTNITEVGMYPNDAISCSYLVFLESFHEDVSENNFVYPLGNVQYLGGNTDGLTGIANGSFSGFETYSLFGNWQTASALIGKGYVWSSLTEAQKKVFIANPDNNCYLDGAKGIQVRYRGRVLIGEDTNSMAKATVQGKAVIPSSTLYTAPVITVDAGLYSNTSTTYGYDGKVNAISISNVQRRNQGMYHPVYNANGTKKASDSKFWYETTVSFTSISDCFNPDKLLTASGYIGSVSGRPDGLFYDQVHEGDITDLRNSSKKVEDYNRLISREFNKLVAGTNRGKEGSMELKNYLTSTINTKSQYTYAFGACTYVKLNTVPPSGFSNEVYLNDSFTIFIKGNTKWYRAVSASTVNNDIILHPMYGNVTADFTVANSVDVLFIKKSTRTKSNTLLHCDIIGNPTNYPSAWKESGVFGTPLTVAEDGTSLLPNGILDTFKLSRKANATPLLCLRSTDNGATWTSFTPTFSIQTSTITLTDEPAGNLVVVYYQTHTSMAVPVTNSEVLEIGDVFATTHYAGTYGGYLSNTLISKSPTSTGVTRRFNYYKLNNCPMQPTPIRVMMTGTGVEPPSHIDANLLYIDNTPAIKVFPYLTRLNGKAYLNLVFKEMKYNGTTWGDDAKFNIVDNVSTTTDNNAQTILIGQKTVELPYFIGADE